MEEGTGGEGVENGNEEPEEEEDEPSEPRQYELRRNRAPVDRLNIRYTFRNYSRNATIVSVVSTSRASRNEKGRPGVRRSEDCRHS